MSPVPGPGPAVHLAFPVRLGAHGQLALGSDEDYLRWLVELVLFTRPGERVNRPDFGSGVDSLVFAPAGDEAAAATRALVHGALQTFLGDLIRVEAVDVQAEESTLAVTISYRPLLAPADDPRRVLTVSAGTGSAGGGTP